MQEVPFVPAALGSLCLVRIRPLHLTIRLITKRVFDFAMALILLVVTMPLFIFLIVALLSTGQSPFYAHTRIGRNGQTFGCLKFRSMRQDADRLLRELLERDPAAKLEWEAYHKLRHDPRITRLGKVLRSTSLDEIPQLLNIIAGHMSFVGPRPVTAQEFAKFYDSEGAAAYLSVRPGLTGPWQISGRSETCYETRVSLDTKYVQRLSLRTDMIILVQTLEVIIRRKGAW